METKNKNKKTVIMLAVIGIAIVCICVIGVFAKKAYDRHQEELRLQAIETKNSEIDGEYQRFEKEYITTSVLADCVQLASRV